MKKRYLALVVSGFTVLALFAVLLGVGIMALRPSGASASPRPCTTPFAGTPGRGGCWVLTPLPQGGTVKYPAGAFCPFAFDAYFDVNKEYNKVLEVSLDGTFEEVLDTGALKTTLTNESNGKSLDVNASGPGKTTTYPDGTTTVDATGLGVVFLTPPMQAEVGLPGFFLIKGHYLETFYPDGTVSFTYTGSYTDLCAALS